jgi:hypothetical protein
MKKLFRSIIPAERINYDEGWSLNIHISTENLQIWCLSLQLLCDKLIDSIIFPIQKTTKIMEFVIENYSCCEEKSNGKGFKVSLDSRDCDFIRHFFLRYYRDGIAEVDHIDIESHGKNMGDIIFTVDNTQQPLSPAEAIKRLAID